MQIFSHPTEEERKILPRLIIGGSTYLLSPANIDKFINLCHVEEYSNGEFIMETGKIFNRLGIVISGITRVWHTENNTEKTLYFGLANTVCVSMHGFLFDFPAAENREACGTVRLLVINRDDFRRFMETDSEVPNWFLGRLMFQLYGFEKKHKMLRGTAKEQYQAIVEHRPYILNKVPLKHIASYIGITPAYLSCIRAEKTPREE